MRTLSGRGVIASSKVDSLRAQHRARLRKLCTARSTCRRQRIPTRVVAFIRANGDWSRHKKVLLSIIMLRRHRRIAFRPRPLSTGLAWHKPHLRQRVKPSWHWRCLTFCRMTSIRSVRHVRRFHFPVASHRSGCFHRCITCRAAGQRGGRYQLRLGGGVRLGRRGPGVEAGLRWVDA